MSIHNDRVFTLISKRDVKSNELAIVEINERISRIKDETKQISEMKTDIHALKYSKLIPMLA